MNLSNFERNLALGNSLLKQHECLAREFNRLGEAGHMGVLGALIAGGYDTRESIAFMTLKLLPPEQLSSVMWALEKGTGVTRQRRLWDRQPDGRYVLRV